MLEIAVPFFWVKVHFDAVCVVFQIKQDYLLTYPGVLTPDSISHFPNKNTFCLSKKRIIKHAKFQANRLKSV